MIAAAIILGILVVAGAILYIHDRLTRKPKPAERSESSATPESTEFSDRAEGAESPAGNVCCGMHIVCEKDSLSTAASSEIIYYDDEELDIYAGRQAETYSDDETEQFREILLTLLPTDIAGWARSLQLRGINLPEAVRDELLMIIAEARSV